ncbi:MULTISPECIES: LacI family DNA-binding transcriptional regulator [unclassified Rhizobium]|uniref:LacI family DNA-binding transcriptional regulator n=1 Tax=unclassified Rhizobium TaxID=2613769 RepID=UPI001A9A18EF|nr:MULTISPECIES: LacI family DNA-binding transcriptional regulator [unclassified Rhizobium]MBX5156614.1 LacI family DNA-binding transcriptional regulator [Rhizobium sp. NZLR8]MBX5162739.1 LacI family DNA-binding transcriptional regulator [Rhizobium sp. NZLR4b]MBX5193988.1 LacI family DNA-binding transcriptional regulator [Rhizobium sp. NZLR10]MBX5200138.1 LacI family DNA-binding transcriptional regulator [Rhizobium sp. NZLR1]MBX5207158.1 LacI family DNA-binding transcriptional regulator [Rhizo
MRKRATAKEVAEAAGVSKWTVIRAFTSGASITDASRQKVLRAAEALNYSPNLLARSLATNITHQVAVFVDDFANPHKLPVLEMLTERLQAEGLLTVLININRHFDHIHALINADQRQFDAVILFGTAFREETLGSQRLGPGFPPMFVLARDSQIPGVPAVACNAELALGEIVNYLFERGYRRPGFMTGGQTLSTALGRRHHYLKFWQRKGVEGVVELTAERYSAEAGAKVARAYLNATSPSSRIDVLMCENDILALGAMDVVRSEFALRVPHDLAIVGFDNIELSAAPAYQLTSYEQPADEMIDTMVAMITGKREAETIILPGRLVPRSSA